MYVSRKGWQTERPIVKLDYQAAGPFKILEKVGYSFRLQLPKHIKIHDVIHADRLRKASMNPLEGQEEDPQPPMEIDGQQEWEVRRIVASRIWRGKLQYRAEWKNFMMLRDLKDALTSYVNFMRIIKMQRVHRRDSGYG